MNIEIVIQTNSDNHIVDFMQQSDIRANENSIGIPGCLDIGFL
jgi:hypothetical protein